MIGQSCSTSLNACIIQFVGGGPYDGKSGLFDFDGDHLTISVQENGIQYDYARCKPRVFQLTSVWIKDRRFELKLYKHQL